MASGLVWDDEGKDITMDVLTDAVAALDEPPDGTVVLVGLVAWQRYDTAAKLRGHPDLCWFRIGKEDGYAWAYLAGQDVAVLGSAR